MVAAGVLALPALGALTAPAPCARDSQAIERTLADAGDGGRPLRPRELRRLEWLLPGVEAPAISPIAPPALQDGRVFRDGGEFIVVEAPRPCTAVVVVTAYQQRAYELSAALAG